MKKVSDLRFLFSLLLMAFTVLIAAARPDHQRAFQEEQTLPLEHREGALSEQDTEQAAFKSSHFILNNGAKDQHWVVRPDTIIARGAHDLFFGVGQIQSDRDELPIKPGNIKYSRPIWVLFLTFLLFLVLGVLKIVFPVEVRTIVEAYYRERLLLQVSKEDNLATSWPYIFLYVLFSLSLGLFVVIVLSSFGQGKYLTFENFLKNSLLVGVLFIAKILIIRFISFVFLLDKIAREYIAVLYLVYFNSMFCLMPFLLAAVFVPSSYLPLLLIIYVVFVVLLFAYRFLRTAIHLFSNFKFSIFYLILYLCTLEIAPILILVRALNK